ncbi:MULTISPECIES: HPr family phosphocarrier protein [unclassified Streptomyces]|uniref:HPr family phosphocarrier protein n=1 Tax=unclassified Streptomyces TaxID=2593676 RepID=UPI0022567A7D|nr:MULTISPECIES: HPr family phosphocarrier protein [unclassified Streptomyces]MCX5048888.1 HPr family phosphocarrier protein [Streptomyces sp. NBC_00474]MCX5246729.1 HPr family phosphocarrier protein [Streptomyces sp. NBC_00201]
MSTSSESTTTNATIPSTHETAVVLPANLHARPAGQLARAAATFTSAIQLEYADRTVNPTGVLAVMGLGATVGSTVTVRAEGHDAEQAVTTLAQILSNAE